MITATTNSNNSNSSNDNEQRNNTNILSNSNISGNSNNNDNNSSNNEDDDNDDDDDDDDNDDKALSPRRLVINSVVIDGKPLGGSFSLWYWREPSRRPSSSQNLIDPKAPLKVIEYQAQATNCNVTRAI